VLAAGRGTRVAAFGGHLHKALLPLGDVPVLTRVVRSFPDDTAFVVALGHLADQIRDYLVLAHPDTDFTFVNVDPYEGPGSGPGRSLWECRTHLQGPFVLTACDAICTEPIPLPTTNWMGVQDVADPENWCTLELDDDEQVRALVYKDASGPSHAFVGVAGIADAETFFDGLERSLESSGEVQVNAGFEALVFRGITTTGLGWLDAGTDSTYRATRAQLGIDRDLTFAGKATDVTYLVGDAVVKMFFDEARADRQARRLRATHGIGPELLAARPQGIAYRFAAGSLYDADVGPAQVVTFLDWMEAGFWEDRPAVAPFAAACREFYFAKTGDRLDLLLEYTGWDDEPKTLVVNGRETRPVRDLLADLAATPSFVEQARASTFHGDLHGRNILTTNEGFCLIDWREDFGGSLDVGDRYYDLAKFLHTLELTVDVMEQETFGLSWSGDQVAVTLPPDDRLAGARAAFWAWAGARYDARQIAIVDAIVFVNMAPLYEPPLREYLYVLGRLLLDTALDSPVPPAEIFDTTVRHDLRTR